MTLGGALEWLRGRGSQRRADAADRDNLFASLTSGCTGLMIEARLLRNQEKPASKLTQMWFGLAESLAANPTAGTSDVSSFVLQLMAGAAVNGLQHLSPVSRAEGVRRNLLPMLTEIYVLTVRLTLTSDERIRQAAGRLSDAAGGLLEHIDEPERAYRKREKEFEESIGQLRRARDAAASRRFARRRTRRIRSTTSG